MPPRPYRRESADASDLAGSHTEVSPIRSVAGVSVLRFARSRWTVRWTLACSATVVHAWMDETGERGDCCPLTSWYVADAWKGSTSVVNTNWSAIDRARFYFSAGYSSSRKWRRREPAGWEHRRPSNSLEFRQGRNSRTAKVRCFFHFRVRPLPCGGADRGSFGSGVSAVGQAPLLLACSAPLHAYEHVYRSFSARGTWNATLPCPIGYPHTRARASVICGRAQAGIGLRTTLRDDLRKTGPIHRVVCEKRAQFVERRITFGRLSRCPVARPKNQPRRQVLDHAHGHAWQWNEACLVRIQPSGHDHGAQSSPAYAHRQASHVCAHSCSFLFVLRPVPNAGVPVPRTNYL